MKGISNLTDSAANSIMAREKWLFKMKKIVEPAAVGIQILIR